MSRQLVKVGDAEPLEFEWLLNDGQRPTGAEVRAYIVVAGVKHYWNGSAFTITDATLPGTFSNGVWTGEFVYPAGALLKEVFVEARPLGLADIADEVIVDSRYVSNNHLDDIAARLGTSSDPGGTDTVFAYLRSIVELYLADPQDGLNVIYNTLITLQENLGYKTDGGNADGNISERTKWLIDQYRTPAARHGRL